MGFSVSADANRKSVALHLEGVSKSFGGTAALLPTTLEIAGGTLVGLLGPSGCGKTTTLRVVAGFEMPDTGAVVIGGQNVTDLPPNRRRLGMVFQNYCLFPHMTVGENIAFGLKMARLPAGDIAPRVRAMLDMVQLSGFEGRFTSQLSGGQQQRVALARALVTTPDVLLLDEPLAALDKNLRESMQFELRHLQQRLGITTILVTHDQEEALTVCDQIAVMNRGGIVQLGTPIEVYERPRTRFVSEFLGTSNIFVCESVGADGARHRVAINLSGREQLNFSVAGDARLAPGAAARLAIRPEKMTLRSASESGGHVQIEARVFSRFFRGTHHAYQVEIAGRAEPIYVYHQTGQAEAEVFSPGEQVFLTWDPSHAVLLENDEAR